MSWAHITSPSYLPKRMPLAGSVPRRSEVKINLRVLKFFLVFHSIPRTLKAVITKNPPNEYHLYI